MARELQHLYLHLAQLRLEGERALTRDYHTQKVKDLIGENNRLIDHLLATYDEATLKANIDLFYWTLWFLGNSHSYIVSSTSDDVRSEIFTCLRFVLKEWIPNPETYVIICSQGDYAYNRFQLGKYDFYDQIESYFGFIYGIKMIPIKMPFDMQSDFMFNAALYHEIGHFIDHYHKITESIVEEVKNGKKSIPQVDVYLKDMTKDAATDIDGYYKQLTAYIQEYFADLFAARYTSKSLFQYLNYVNPKGEADDEHPTTTCREKVVDEFLGDPANYSDFLKLLLSNTKDINGTPLQPNTLNTDISSFVDQKECDKPDSEQHVHSIIPNLWEIWNNRRGEFKDATGVPMNFIEIYKTLMDLTAKTVQKLQ